MAWPKYEPFSKQLERRAAEKTKNAKPEKRPNSALPADAQSTGETHPSPPPVNREAVDQAKKRLDELNDRNLERRRLSKQKKAANIQFNNKVDRQLDENKNTKTRFSLEDREIQKARTAGQKKKIERQRLTKEKQKITERKTENNIRLDQLQRLQKERRLQQQKALQHAQKDSSPESAQSHQAGEIRTKVKRAYEQFLSSKQQPFQLTRNELAFAAVAIASSNTERRNAIELIKASEESDEVLGILFENLKNTEHDGERKNNIIFALGVLGQSGEVHEILSGQQGPEPASTLEKANVLDWAVLPPGWWNNPRYTDHVTKDSQTTELVLERLRYIDQLNPSERWRSEERFGSDPYWVFVFPHHVVAECPTHGNAIYIIKGTSDWRNLLNRSKADLLKAFPDRVVRIMHRGDWESRLRQTIRV